ncbi:MAG: phosphatase PAP2 family protein [Siculibacillus sp.]|nr:phosphatase PAP2 family protein [Siculibacillus sp.]
MRTREALIALLGVFGRRIVERSRAGLAILSHRRARRAAMIGPRDEAPAFVMAATLTAALAAVAFLDPSGRDLGGGATGGWRSFLKTLTSYGEGVEILVVSAAILVFCLVVPPEGLARRVRAGLVEIGFAAAFAFVAVAGSGIAASAIKNVFGRARPEHLAGANVFELHPLSFAAKYASFPSGHSTTAGATAMVLALLFPAMRAPILAVGGAVALSRILLDAHFPADVIAGFGFGAAFTLTAAHALARRNLVFRRRADGRLEPKAADRPGNWPDVLAALIDRAKAPKA